jgi:hypothetical protein
MLPGFNHSVKHRGTVYHVQTEDSGVRNPLVSTHLFLGGNVLATRRTSYAELVGSPDAEARVRKLMQEQHKDMLRQLVRGAFDRQGAAAAPSAFQPGQLAGAAPVAKQPQAPVVVRGRAAAPPPPAPAPKKAVPAADEPPVLSRVRAGAAVVIPEIEDEDLLSDRRLDEVILAYLADPGMKRG